MWKQTPVMEVLLRGEGRRRKKDCPGCAECHKHPKKGCLDEVKGENTLLTVVTVFYMHVLKICKSLTCTHKPCYIHNSNALKCTFTLPV